MPDNNDTTANSSVTKPSWNTSPNTLPGFVLDLQKYLPKRDARYKALVEYGFTGTFLKGAASYASATITSTGFDNNWFRKAPLRRPPSSIPATMTRPASR